MGASLTTPSTVTPIERTIPLKSSDGKIFEVPESACRLSGLLTEILEHRTDDAPIDVQPMVKGAKKPAYNVDAKMLAMVISWCIHHSNDEQQSDEQRRLNRGVVRMPKFDREFLMVDQETFNQLTNAAYHLEIRGLVDIICQTVTEQCAETPRKRFKSSLPFD